jgi:beta-glucosidase
MRLRLAVLALIAAHASCHAAGAASTPDERVEKLLRSLTLDEKISLISGTGFGTHPIARVGIPAFQMSDGPLGVRALGPSTAFAAGVALAASWDAQLANEIGTQMGRDARSRGVQFVLGPAVNIYRAPMNGRNFEYLGEDPWLASRIVVSYIEGIQSLHVSATIKHFAGNNSEYARHTSDSTIDERTLREIYLPTFEAAVKEAHVGAVMSSYNLLNGERTTANPHLIRQILKADWGFGGLYMSDWGATYEGVAAANAGLDLEMPTGRFMNAKTLVPAIQGGQVSESVIDDKVRRLLNLAVRFGWLDGQPADLSISRDNQAGREVAHKSALESAVLLKNDGSLLPLDLEKVHTLAVIGPNAYPAVIGGGGSAHVASFEPVSVLQGLSDKLGSARTVTYAQGIPALRTLALRTVFTTQRGGKVNGVTMESFPDASFSGQPRLSITERAFATGEAGFGGDADLLTLYDLLPPDRAAELLAPLTDAANGRTFERWTGWYEADGPGPYTVFVQDTGGYRLLIDDEVVIDSAQIPKAILRQTRRELSPGPHKVVLEQMAGPDVGRVFLRVGIVRQGEFVDGMAKELAARADAVVVPVGFDADIESEGGDREFSLPPGQNELIEAVAAANPNTIVVVNAGGSVDVTPWIGSVKALVQAWYPGQESGAALAELLTGAVSPSGRLPISWERAITDDPTFANYYYNDPMHPDRIVYREGVFVGYRGFQHTGSKPLFPFGFGLSYTSFRYSDFAVKPAPRGGPGLYTVTFNVTNSGARQGADVAQIYVGAKSPRVPRPVRELKAFARIDLAPGETKLVTLTLGARSFAYYDVKSSRWRADAGEYRIELGRSSEDIQAAERVKLRRTLQLAPGD